jgi:protease-4
MSFARKVWKLLVAIKDGLVLLFMLLFFALLYAALSWSPSTGSVREGALLVDLGGSLVEHPADRSPTELISGRSSVARQHRLRDVVYAIEKAADDGRIKAVALDLDSFIGGGQTAIADAAAAVDKVRKAGKPVYAYATGYTDDSYQLASHASELWLNPLGAVLITGPGATHLYYKGLLDKIGVTANVYRVGTYKSAVEPYTRSDMSPEARQAAQALAGALWDDWLNDVKHARPKADLAGYVASPGDRFAAAGGDMAQAALKAGLVDRVGDRLAFEKRVAQVAGTDRDGRPAFYRSTPYQALVDEDPPGESHGDIGVLTVAGELVDGRSGADTAGAETVVRSLEKGLRANKLKALVLRVDSPGGSVLASERMRLALLDAKSRGIPIVVSMGSVAASGGYWISTVGDRIFAEPTTITGSIGVFGILPSFQGTLTKLGLGADGVKTTPLSGEPDVLRGPSPEAGRMLQMGVENTYRRFIGLVSQARGLPPERVDSIAQGRVWDGGTARQLQLVDQFGSLDDAIADAARRAKLDPAKAEIVYLEREPSFLDRVLASAGADRDDDSGDAFSRVASRPQLLMERAIEDAGHMLAGPAIQARCLECPGLPVQLSRTAPTGFTGWLWHLLGR